MVAGSPRHGLKCYLYPQGGDGDITGDEKGPENASVEGSWLDNTKRMCKSEIV